MGALVPWDGGRAFGRGRGDDDDAEEEPTLLRRGVFHARDVPADDQGNSAGALVPARASGSGASRRRSPRARALVAGRASQERGRGATSRSSARAQEATSTSSYRRLAFPSGTCLSPSSRPPCVWCSPQNPLLGTGSRRARRSGLALHHLVRAPPCDLCIACVCRCTGCGTHLRRHRRPGEQWRRRPAPRVALVGTPRRRAQATAWRLTSRAAPAVHR